MVMGAESILEFLVLFIIPIIGLFIIPLILLILFFKNLKKNTLHIFNIFFGITLVLFVVTGYLGGQQDGFGGLVFFPAQTIYFITGIVYLFFIIKKNFFEKETLTEE